MTDDGLEAAEATGADRTVGRRAVRPAAVAAVLVVVVLVAVGLVVALRDAPAEPGSAAFEPAEPRTRSGAFLEMAAGLLSPRDAPVTAWTGTELVVVGGSVRTGADPGLARDGAAYDPATDGWRPIAEAPAPIDARQLAVWTGEEVVVTATAGNFAYDPDEDTWRTLEEREVPATRGDTFAVPVVTSEGIVYPSTDQPDGSDPVDLVLDEDGGVAELPHDPFGASWDRSLAWDGERLWLLSTSDEQNLQRTNDDGRVPSRLAVLEGGLVDGTWRVVDDATPPVESVALLWFCEDRLVVDQARYQDETHAFDRDSGSWSTIPAGEASRCALGATERDGLAGGSTYMALGSRFVDDGTDCPLVRGVTALVWSDEDDLLVWDSLTTLGCRTGGPSGSFPVRDPCPDRLVGNGRVRFGFGPVDPAARAPALSTPDSAYVCRYVPYGPQPSIDGPYSWESDLCCEAIRLTDAELARLTDYLAELTPPGRPCAADRLALTRQARLAAPRYLLSLRTGDDVTGVVLDDFGCGHVRLTDDPSELEPGTHRGSGGVLPGVLRVPPELVERLVQVLQLRYGGVERFPPRR